MDGESNLKLNSCSRKHNPESHSKQERIDCENQAKIVGNRVRAFGSTNKDAVRAARIQGLDPGYGGAHSAASLSGVMGAVVTATFSCSFFMDLCMHLIILLVSQPNQDLYLFSSRNPTS